MKLEDSTRIFTNKFHAEISKLILSHRIRFPRDVFKQHLLTFKSGLYMLLNFTRLLIILVVVSTCVGGLACLAFDHILPTPLNTVFLTTFWIMFGILACYRAYHLSLFLNELCLKMIKPTIAFNLTHNVKYETEGLFSRLKFKDASHFYPTIKQRFTLEDNQFCGKTTVTTSEAYQRVFDLYGIRGLMNAINDYCKIEVSEYEQEDRNA